MSRKLLTVAALAAFALPATATAALAQIGYGIAAGATAPMGDFGKGDEMGYNLSASLLFMPPLAPVGFRIEGMFNEFNCKSSLCATSVKDRVLALTGNAMITSPGIMGPYLIGGVGMYRKTTSPEPVTNSAQTDVGINLGGGFRFGLAGFSAYGEARYHYVGSGTTKYAIVPITFGVTF